MKNTISLYGCGGTGVNIATTYAVSPNLYQNKFGVADIEAYLIDTSRSNFIPAIPEERIAIVEGQEGSGKIRATNHEAIRAQVKSILLKMPPKDVSILVSSASGGSGNIILSYLAREFAQQGHPYIIVMSVEEDSAISSENSYKTLLSLDTIAKQTEVPVIASLHPNISRAKTDRKMHEKIHQIAVLFANEHLELDNSDTKNFLWYNKVTSFKPRLTNLTSVYHASKEELSTVSGISVALLHATAEAQDSVKSHIRPAYLCEGFIRNATEDQISDNGSYIYYTETNTVETIIRALKNSIDEYQKLSSASLDLSLDLKMDIQGEKTDDGIIL